MAVGEGGVAVAEGWAGGGGSGCVLVWEGVPGVDEAAEGDPEAGGPVSPAVEAAE